MSIYLKEKEAIYPNLPENFYKNKVIFYNFVVLKIITLDLCQRKESIFLEVTAPKAMVP